MDIEAARALLGLGPNLSLEEVERAFAARREAAAQRMATAPTDNLRAKYKQSLDELEHAHRLLTAQLRPAAPHLSHTQLGDLPSAQPVYTQSGIGPGTQKLPNLLQAGQVLAGRYEIREKIGLGGMGAVYRAFDRNRKEEIAVKVLLPHLLTHQVARERFLAEAKIASSLSHPNIVNVFDVQRDGDNDFLTMELLQGQTLRQLMLARKAARQPFTVKEALAVAASIGGALDYAHRFTVHRDVKPENIWVEDDGNYKLMDFGIARLMSTSQLTATTTAMGTAYYMAPEQLRAAKSVDGRADQYALAVMLYELISGEIPAGRIKPLKLLNKSVSRGTSQAVDRALDPHPEARFPGMAVFVRALHARGNLLADGAFKWVVGAAATAALGAALLMFWPQISALLPDRAAAQLQRGQAIQAQGVIETLLKRIESAERDIDTQVRDAKSAADRYDGMVRMARSAAEKTDLEVRLREAQSQLALASEVRDVAAQWVFQSDTLAQVRGKLAVGAAALRDGQVEQAATDLLAAQKTVEDLLQLPDDIRDAILARGAYQSVLDRMKTLAEQERMDVSRYLSGADQVVVQAQSAVEEGKFREAVRFYSRAGSETGGALNTMIDELVADYGSFASKAMGARKLSEAGNALARAKMLAKMKYEGS